MPLPPDLPIVDHHCHLSPHGAGVRAGQRFRAAGGTHLFLATQNYRQDVPRSVEAYAEQFEVTATLARALWEEAGVVAYPVVAPYPVDLLRAADELGLERALDLHQKALDLAGRWVRERRAVALGEVGRPHFPVTPEIARAAETAFDYALAVARESDCPVIVHSEDLDAAGYIALAERARAASIRPERVVKHYARARRIPGPELPSTSYVARRELLRDVIADPGPWFLETDFLDDPSRPGAVLDLATVPRRARQIAETVPDGAERLRIPFVESVQRVYGWIPEIRERGEP